jgi:phage baseplate assembly protein W
MATITIFSDIDLRFEKHPVTGDVARKINDEAIKTSMRNLILTKFYERPFNSALGSPISNLLFEPFTPMLGSVIKKSIEQVLTNYEPRIDLESVTVEVKPDDSEVNISVYYRILGSQALKTFSLILERTR